MDTNCWIAYFAGADVSEVQWMDELMSRGLVVLAPMVLSEILSDPHLPAKIERELLSLDLLTIQPGFWERAGKLRAALIARRYRPKLVDTLIAQLCIDHGTALLTRDRDFSGFARHASLRLVTR